MLNRIATHVRHSAVGYLALFVALGGTSYAATSLPAKSVGTKQLKRHAVTNSKIAHHAITNTNIKPGSLLSSAFAPGQVPAGPAGPRGATGLANVTVVKSKAFNVAANSGGSGSVTCPAGQKVLGGGFDGLSSSGGVYVTDSLPDGTSWDVLVNNTNATATYFYVDAVCANTN